MAATIHGLRGCLSEIPTSDRHLLTWRFGIGGGRQLTDAAVAARIGTTSAVVAQREAAAVTRLANAPARGACQPHTPVTASSNSQAAAPVPAAAPASAPVAGGSRASGGGVDGLLAFAVIFACLIVVGYEFRKALFAPPPRH
jgi:hypothetical protein